MKYFGLELAEFIRRVGLGVAVLLEGGAVLSVILNAQFFTIGTLYPNIVSGALFLLPAVVGLLSRRFEVAILLAVLPFWVTTFVYLVAFGSIFNVDLFQLGVLANRVAGMAVLLALLGLLGWCAGRVLTRQPETQLDLS